MFLSVSICLMGVEWSCAGEQKLQVSGYTPKVSHGTPVKNVPSHASQVWHGGVLKVSNLNTTFFRLSFRSMSPNYLSLFGKCRNKTMEKIKQDLWK